jgi:hypothetical protein
MLCGMIITAFLLVGIVTCRAGIEVVRLGIVASVKIAKVAMPNDFEAFVQKASLNDQSFFAADNFLIKSKLRIFPAQIETAESGGWEYDLAGWGIHRTSSILQCDENSCERRAALFLLGGGYESINGIRKIERRFSTCVGVIKGEFYRLSGFYRTCNFGLPWSYPSAASDNQAFFGHFDSSGHGICLLIGRLSLFGGSFCQFSVGVDELGSLLAATLHFPKLSAEEVSLIENADSRQNNEKESGIVSKPLASIFSAFLFAIGALLLFVSVNKSRDSEYAIFHTIATWPVMFAAVWLLLGSLGGHSLDPFNRRSENILVEAAIVSELKFRHVRRHILCTDFVTDNRRHLLTLGSSQFEPSPDIRRSGGMAGAINSQLRRTQQVQIAPRPAARFHPGCRTAAPTMPKDRS